MSNGYRFRAQGCPVCGSRELRMDEVEDGGKLRAASGTRAETSSWLVLAECPRCDHRWTQRSAEVPAPVRMARAVRPEIASAA